MKGIQIIDPDTLTDRQRKEVRALCHAIKDSKHPDVLYAMLEILFGRVFVKDNI